MGQPIAKIIFLLLFFFLQNPLLFSQKNVADSTRKHHNFHKICAISASGTYVGVFFALDKAWYKNGNGNFHFFNDNNNWQGVDKVGHAFSAFHLSRFSYALLKNSGMKENRAAILGGVLGAFSMMPIEYFDGFSKDYGASWGDMLANISGGILFSAQQKIWQEQRFYLKYSYHQSNLAVLRPQIFGETLQENILKDYNGQTLWLSCHANSFLKKKSKLLNVVQISLGYGGRNMLYANPNESLLNGFTHEKTFYLSLDVAWDKIRTKHKFFKTVLNTLHLVKIPFPTLGFSQGKFHFYPLYF